MSSRRMQVLMLVAVIIAHGLGGAAVGQEARLNRVFTITGFAAPECVVIDPDTGLAYVSNMNTGPEGYWQDTGEGFISRLTPDGTIDELKWVESTEEFVINQPKGMDIRDGLLYVADNARVLTFSLADGTPGRVYEPDGAQNLNDMAADADGVYVSDTATGNIFRLDLDGDAHTVVANIESVNGVTLHDGTLFAVSWDLGDVYEVDRTGAEDPKPFGLSEHFTHLDGIHVVMDRWFSVTDFTGGQVALIAADRETVITLYELETPAAHGVDHERRRLWIPQLEHDTVVVLSE